MYISNAVMTETIMFDSVDLLELTRWEEYSEPQTKCDEGSSSGSGSGCSDGCTTEFVFVGTDAPVIGADRSDERAAAAAAGQSLSCGPSAMLVMASLTLPLWAVQTQWR
ncbi:hypothetical protein ATANTOWER_005345 [Ataeniobius toweri]|uniref:Uncharacterized protein n=1 Tax=Ataeniobius toweri TaxID=208326 RepID=A0ABU7BNI0_9TELE|nr:hypothetical protein [Ataeniobius toweri]